MKRLITTIALLLPVLAMSQNCSINGGSGVDGAFVASSNMSLPGGTYNFTSFTINPGVTVSVTGTSPLMVYSTGAVQIDGILKADGGNGADGVTFTNGGIGGVGVAGGADGGSGSYSSSVGPLDGVNGSGTGGANNKGAGWSGGGGGGYAANGASSGGVGGFGGTSYGTADLAAMLAGSGGGGGSGGYSCGAGGGGAGGGLIYISTPATLTIGVGGIISSNGGNGGTDGTGNCGGGGGGSGGAIFLQTGTLNNNGLIRANGGLGGASMVSGNPYYGAGANGSEGRIRIDYITISGSGTITPAGFIGTPLFVTAGTIVPTCSGNSGQATMNISGGTGPYTTLWSNGESSNPAIYLQSGTVTCYISDANGCADTVSLIVPTSNNSFSQSLTICAGDTLVVGSSEYTSSGSYSNVFTNVAGCDSTVNTTLTVLPAISSSQSFTICAGESVTVGNSEYTTSGTFTDVFTSQNGCDSTVNTTLTVLPAISSSQSFTICEGESVTVGNSEYTTSGTYTDILTSQGGCDSTVTTQVSVSTLTAAASLTNNTITASPAGQSYQWFDCSNDSIISGATSETYVATADGQYAVIVTNGNNCSDTSDCVVVNLIGLNELTANSVFAYPNPTNGMLTVEFTLPTERMTLTDVTGRMVFEANNAENAVEIDLSNESKGVYFLHVWTEGKVQTLKVTKQ